VVIQPEAILISTPYLILLPLAMAMPKIALTTACELDTGTRGIGGIP